MASTTIYEPRSGPTTGTVTAKSSCDMLPNVGDTERLVSALAGGGLIAWGLTRGSLSGALAALLGGSLVYRGISGHCMGYQAMGIDTSGFDHPAVGVRSQHGFKFETSIAIDRSPEDLFQFWSRLENLPLVMDHLISITILDGARSHWVARAPLGSTVEWDAETINLRENELIAWSSVPGSQLDTAGSVHFKPLGHDRGTLLKLSLKYDPPFGAAGATLASLLGGGLEQRVESDLRRFKQWAETGEVPTSAGMPRGTCR